MLQLSMIPECCLKSSGISHPTIPRAYRWLNQRHPDLVPYANLHRALCRDHGVNEEEGNASQQRDRGDALRTEPFRVSDSVWFSIWPVSSAL